MFSFHSIARSQFHRQWLLLWLLPYLVFTVAGEGMHTEAWPSSPHPATSKTHLAKSVQPAQEDNCLMCQWAAQSTASFAPPAALKQESTPAPVHATYFPTSLHNPPLTSRKRGPPLV